LTKRFRWKATAAFVQNITDSTLLNFLAVATSATNLQRLLQGVRLRNIELWGPMPASLVPVSAGIVYPTYTAFSGSAKEITDSSMGSNRSAHVKMGPPVDTAQSLWIVENGTTFVTINGPIGTVIDLTLDIVFLNGIGSPVVSAPVSVGATIGVVYMRSLDGNAAATANFIPQAYDLA
jgi:hypothetical protein